MKKALIAVAAVVVLLVGALAALPLFISTETVKAELIARIEEATGRKARIDGPVSIGVLPSAHLSAEGIGLAGLIGDSEAFTVDAVSFGLDLLPLVSGNVEINGVTIERPTIVVEVDADGRSNWSAATGPATATAAIEDLIKPEPAAAPPSGGAAGGLDRLSLDRLSLGRVTIKDGTLVYRDAAAGTEERIEAVNLDIDLPRVNGAGTVDGSFTWRGLAETVKLAVGERPAAAPFERIPVELSLTSEAMSLSAKGILLDEDALFAGTVEASAPSLADAAGRFGVALPAAPAFGKFAASSTVALTAAQLHLQDLAADLGGMRVTGAAALAYDRPVPGAAIRLHADRIDSALFAGATSGSGGGGNGGGGKATGAGGGGNGGAIDLSALGLIDANAELSADEVAIGSVAIARLAVGVQLAGRVLSATVKSIEIAGAPGSGNVTVDASGATPSIAGAVKINGLDIAGLRALAGQSTPVAGTAGADVTFRTSGATSAALLANLDASGKVSLANGRIGGLGLADTIGGEAAADVLDDMDVTASFTSLASPVAVDGGLTWRGERFALSARTDPRALLSGKATDIALQAKSKRVNFGFTGKAGLAGAGSGKISLSTPSLRDLLAWIGHPIGAGGGLKAFSIDGAVALGADSFSFDNAAFTLDQSSGVGTGSVDFGAKPAIKAGLAMKVLDVTPYLAASGVAKGAGGGGGAAGGGGGSGGKAGGRAGPWSTANIGFGGLKAIDANLNLAAERIIADDIKIGKSALTVTVAGGKLQANLSEMALYSGSGVGVINIDGAAAQPALDASFQLSNVSALPFLGDALGFTRVEGTASFNFDVKASGASQAALVKGLNGQGAVRFADGAIRGIDIPKMVQTLSVQTLLGWQPGDERTAFDDMSGTFAIANGILTNNDLTMAGPLFSMTGAGTVDIPRQTLAYRVDPKIVASLDGKKSKDLEGFAVPVRIEGAWDRPKIYPEIEGILEDPQKALEQLRGLGGGLLGAIGGGKPSKTPAAEKPKAGTAPAADAVADPTADPPAAGARPKPKPNNKKKKPKAKSQADQAVDALGKLIGQ